MRLRDVKIGDAVTIPEWYRTDNLLDGIDEIIDERRAERQERTVAPVDEARRLLRNGRGHYLRVTSGYRAYGPIRMIVRDVGVPYGKNRDGVTVEYTWFSQVTKRCVCSNCGDEHFLHSSEPREVVHTSTSTFHHNVLEPYDVVLSGFVADN